MQKPSKRRVKESKARKPGSQPNRANNHKARPSTRLDAVAVAGLTAK